MDYDRRFFPDCTGIVLYKYGNLGFRYYILIEMFSMI
jgi:hypothetical protein